MSDYKGEPSGSPSPAMDITDTMTPLEAALVYARHGWEVLPIVTGTKRPYIEWRDGGLADPGKIRSVWERYPDAQVAVVTGERSGIIVIDCDGEQGIANFGKLMAEHDDLILTVLQAATPSGGRHYFFGHPGGRIPCSASKLASGVDVRGDGGYVVVPPSRC